MKKLAAATAASIAGIFAGVQLVDLAKEVVKTADTMRLLDGRLKLVTDSQEEFTRAQEELFDIANETRNALEGTVGLYTRMARSAENTGKSQGEMLQVTDSINKALTVSGAEASSANAALIQLSQGLAANAFRGEEMNSVLEQTPRVAQLIADGLGVGIARLREMGSAGELTADKVITAILSQRDVIDREFAQMPKTVGQALTVATNHFQKFIREFDKASGMSDTIVKGIEDITSAIKGLDSKEIAEIASAMSLIGSTAATTIKVVAAYYALFSGPAVIAAIGSWIKSMYTAAQATMQVNAAVAAGDAVMLNSAKATAMKTAAEAESAAMAVKSAQAQVARTEADIAAVQAKIALINTERNQIMTLIQEGSVTADVTVLENKFAIASRQAAAAQMDLRNASAANTAAQTALATAQAKSTASTQAAAAAATKAKTAFLTLNNAANVLFAAFIGWEIGKWLTDNFEEARIAGIWFVDRTIQGFYEIERVAKLVFAFLSSGWTDWLNDARSAYADFLDFASKGIGFISKEQAGIMQQTAKSMRKVIEKELTFEEAKVQINLEFDEKSAERARRINEMLIEASDATRRTSKKISEQNKDNKKTQEDLTAAQKKYIEQQDQLVASLLPLQTAHTEYQNNLKTLEDWYERNKNKTNEYKQALNNLNAAYTETIENIQSAKIKEATAPMFKAMLDRISLEREAIEMASENMEISESEGIQKRIALLEKEIEIRQRLLTTIIGNSAAAQIARQDELLTIEQIKLKIQELKGELSDNSWLAGTKAAWQEYSQSALNAGQQAKNFWMNTFNSMENAVMEFVETGTFEIEKLAKAILADLLRIYVRALLVKTVMSALGGGGGGGGGGLFHDGMSPSYKPPKFHGGMSPGYQPPRLHNGLKPDEFPAILQVGERVTSKKDVKDQNRQLADYERWKMNGRGEEGGGVNISVPIALDPTYSKRFRSELQQGIEGTVMSVVKRMS